MNRRRGGQPGNRNALTHGFYEAAVAEAERPTIKRAEEISPADLDHEIALLRARLLRLAQRQPDNIALLCDGMRTLVRLVEARHRLTPTQTTDLEQAIAGVLSRLNELTGISLTWPE